MVDNTGIERLLNLERVLDKRIKEKKKTIEKEEKEIIEPLIKDIVAQMREMVPENKKSFTFGDLQLFLHSRQNGICPYCQSPLTDPKDKEEWSKNPCDVDHVIPFSKGGGNENANLQLIHHGCNLSKGNKVATRTLIGYLSKRFDRLGIES